MTAPLIKSPEDGMQLSAIRLAYLKDELSRECPGFSIAAYAREQRARHERRHDALAVCAFVALIAVTFSLLVVTTT